MKKLIMLLILGLLLTFFTNCRTIRTITIENDIKKWDTKKTEKVLSKIIADYNVSNEDQYKILQEIKQLSFYIVDLKYNRDDLILQIKSADGYIIKVLTF